MKTRILAVLALGSVFLAVAGVTFWYALVHTVHSGALAVPDLEGLAVAEARRVAHDVGLELEVDEEGVFSAEVRPGEIAAQEPHPGFHVKTGSKVAVRLSLGSERAAVPGLRGESLSSAMESLRRKGLTPGHRVQVAGQAAGDALVATDPPAEQRVALGAEVAVLFNLSPAVELWVMPSLVDRPLSRVRAFCRRHHLRLGQVHEVDYPMIAAGRVLRQYPSAGSPFSRADVITVWVSAR